MRKQPVTDRATILSLAGMVAGLAITLAAVAWMAVVKPSTVWTPQQAAEYQQAGDAVHAARSRHTRLALPPPAAGRPSVEPADDELAAAQDRFNRISDQLSRARNQHQRWGRWAAGAGLALTILSGVGYLASRPA